MKSLQNQYNLIKEGKGSKEIFLKEAKFLFPQYIPNSMGFDNTVIILKQRAVLTESSEVKEIIKKKESFETKFSQFLAEAKKKENGIKADLKKTDKSVEKVNDVASYDNDIKTADNVIFDQYMRGIYTEMSKDPKQDLEAVKKKVLKNLTKDPLYYLKNGQFGLDGVGYTDELPGAKGGKTDQMVPLSKAKDKANVNDTLGKKERAKGNPDKVKTMTTSTKNTRGVKKTAPPTKGKIIKLKENQSLEDLMNEVDTSEAFSIFQKLDKAKDTARKYAKDEDCVVHVNKLSNGNYKIEDWFDSDNTVASYGPQGSLRENELEEGQDNNSYIKRLATDLCKNTLFAGDTKYDGKPENLMKDYSSEDIETFYEEIFGKLPLGNPATFSVNERISNIINKVVKEGALEDADAMLAKQYADAEAKAAQIDKQRADNKAKIAAAEKNI